MPWPPCSATLRPLAKARQTTSNSTNRALPSPFQPTDWHPFAPPFGSRFRAIYRERLAQVNLVLVYDIGLKVPLDYAQAVAWYRKAADQGNAVALNNLGLMYDKGEGIPQDYVRAHRWWNLAAAGSSPDDAETRKKAAKNRDIVAAKMTPQQIAEAQRLAREWKPK